MKQKRIHLSWPENRLQSSRTTEVELRLYGKSKPSGVLPLKCDSWTVLQNPDFNFLTLGLRPRTDKTASKWYEALGYPGHALDVIVSTKSFSVRLYRPVCTMKSSSGIAFHYLPYPLNQKLHE